MAPRNWRVVVDQMSDVQKLVHLASRKDPLDADQVRTELLRERRRYYEAELTAQARRVGCPGRTGALGNNLILSELNEQSRLDAESIANTFNYDLAIAINHIRAQVPTANRFVYAKRLEAWEAKRATWKTPQIEQNTELTARARAQQDFYQFNAIFGVAELVPKTAVCPVCQGWIDRGEVPIHVARNNPPPYHTNCVHSFAMRPDRVAREECKNLWMGQ